MITQCRNTAWRQVAADLGIADHAGCQGYMKFQQVACCTAIQHEAGIGHGRLMLRRGLDVVL
ncbi:hypothetical protein D3C81_2229190 [compost metagenome]